MHGYVDIRGTIRGAGHTRIQVVEKRMQQCSGSNIIPAWFVRILNNIVESESAHNQV